MKNLIKYTAFVMALLSVQTAFSQDKSTGEEPYPAPAMYDNVTASEANFIALFEDKNVGNTHVYIPKRGKMVGDNEPYGSIISKEFKDFLPTDVQMMVHVEGSEPRALYSIRGGNGELYVIQTTDRMGNQTIGLYALNNESVTKLKDLAYLRCKESGCRQMDSWLQDIDGDTRIDIIQKRAKTKTANGRTKVKTTTYRIQRDGSLKKDKKLAIDEADYIMEKR